MTDLEIVESFFSSFSFPIHKFNELFWYLLQKWNWHDSVYIYWGIYFRL